MFFYKLIIDTFPIFELRFLFKVVVTFRKKPFAFVTPSNNFSNHVGSSDEFFVKFYNFSIL